MSEDDGCRGASGLCRPGHEGTRIGDITLCRVCDKAIQLLRSRNPYTRIDIDFWAHTESLVLTGPPETHKAWPKRMLWDA